MAPGAPRATPGAACGSHRSRPEGACVPTPECPPGMLMEVRAGDKTCRSQMGTSGSTASPKAVRSVVDDDFSSAAFSDAAE